jgi:hypothetical protein
VGGRRQSEDHYTRARIAEAGDRFAPILLVTKRRAFLARDVLAIAAQPLATVARHDG